MTELVAIRPPKRGLLRGSQPHLRDLSRARLRELLAPVLGGPRYRADQVFEWLHRHRVTDIEAMSNLAREARVRLAQWGRVSALAVDHVARSTDGTLKLRLLTDDTEAIECVLIPNEARGYTLCVSSMIGCSLTCRFCATATLGFIRNLCTWEIVDQVYRAIDLLEAEAAAAGERYVGRITNLVLMGMGEPLHNYAQVQAAIDLLTDKRGTAIAARRITISTAGLVPGIERFGRGHLAQDVGLAISLNATTDAQRDRLMPINTRWNIATLLDAVRALPPRRRRCVTFEYVLLAGVNDSREDAERLVGLMRGLDAQVNAIPWNPHPAASFARPRPEAIEQFVNRVRRGGIPIYLRRPRGDDIAAACGQLALHNDRPQ